MDKQELRELVSEARTVIHDSALFIKSNVNKVTSEQVIEKGVNSLVSYVDQQSESILIAGLSKILPDAGFITEEEMVEQSQKKYTWIIDPLDGTTNFLHAAPYFSVSVALHDGDKVIAGIVHEVTHDEVFFASTGNGAFLNKKSISVTNRPAFYDVLIGTGFPYKTEHLSDGHFDALRNVLNKTRGIRRFGSAALDLCYVACGRFGAFYEKALNSYDIAAGALIVLEAGGMISDFRGGNDWLFEGEILATAPQFRKEMLDILEVF
ncbi:MAG: inositol monophosphatase [Saprospiraceae bacterium]|jgi:myo-inositol-1(or 4)-monophosphatase|nr:inositol monophosphatase [Saprospiraceae bacterium]MBL0024360.1 inositol monophosphatase [Saprospiraceae bacterium]